MAQPEEDVNLLIGKTVLTRRLDEKMGRISTQVGLELRPDSMQDNVVVGK